MTRNTKRAAVVAEEPEQTSLAIFEIQNPVAVYTDGASFDRYFDQVRQKYADGFVADISTDKGRKEVASQAFKITKEKTSLVAAGKKLTEEARLMIKAVNDARNGMEDRLDALAKEVRAPLTEWEAAEEKRIIGVETIISTLRSSAVVEFDETAADVGFRIDGLHRIEITEAHFQGHYGIAISIRDQTILTLNAAIVRLEREEAERAELMQLRAEQEARLERERVEREAREVAAYEAARIEEEKADAERRRLRAIEIAAEHQAEIERAAKAAEDLARARAVTEAREAQEAAERRHIEALAVAQRRADEAEAAQKREADRIAREKAIAEAEAKRLADEQAARDKDRAHRGKVMAAAKEAIMMVGVSEETAKKVVLAIVADEIPAVRMTF